MAYNIHKCTVLPCLKADYPEGKFEWTQNKKGAGVMHVPKRRLLPDGLLDQLLTRLKISQCCNVGRFGDGWQLHFSPKPQIPECHHL